MGQNKNYESATKTRTTLQETCRVVGCTSHWLLQKTTF